MKVIKYDNKYYQSIKNIYENTFPKNERFLTLEEMLKKKDTELNCLILDEDVLGFIYTIKYKKSIYILYLAIDSKYRSNGYGSQLLKWCTNNYKDCGLFLNIEELNPQKKDYSIREKRFKFYQKNGFYLSNIMTTDGIENFHVLSNQKNVDLDEYTELFQFHAKLLDATLINPFIANNKAEI